MTFIPPIVQYVVDLNLFAQPWPVVAISLSAVVAYFTLLYHLGDCLKGTGSYLSVTQRKLRIRSLRVAKDTLYRTAKFCGITLILLLGKILLSGAQDSLGIAICSLVTFFVTIFSFLNLGTLAIVGLAIEDYIFEFKRQEAEMACVSIDAVVYLKCGNRVKGSFRDLGLLKGKRYFQFMVEDGSVVTLESSDVAAVFLQSVYGHRKTLGDKLFTEGPRSLQITFPHNEVFHNTPYFTRNDFSILKIAKPTTRSRYAIVDTEFVKVL